MARICPLFSGSGGNSTYIYSDGCGILIDAGASFKALSAALQNAGGEISKLKAVAVTHEHSDHISGLKTLLKKTGIPLMASQKTLEKLISMNIVPPETETVVIDGEREVGDMVIGRFDTMHDCAGSSGYTVRLKDGRKIAVCTDLGKVTDTVREALKGSRALLFESNHDIRMLQNGPYTASLKLRILSDNGHLSNSACACELPELLKSGTTSIILGHISKNNNLPMLAVSAARACLADIGAVENEDYVLSAAKPAGNEVTVI